MTRPMPFFRFPSLFLSLLLSLAVLTASAVHADEVIRSRLEALQLGHQIELAQRPIVMEQGVRRLYEQRNHELLWFSEPGVATEAVDTLMAAIDDARHHGLRPQDYHREAIQRRLQALNEGNGGDFASQDLDMLLSDALLLLAGHLQQGKTDAHAIDPQWTGTRRSLQWLDESLSTFSDELTAEALSAFLDARAPRADGYQHLLAARRELAAQIDEMPDSWQRIPGGATLRAGDTDPRIALVEERLRELGDLSDEVTLEQAIRDFQQRHGLSSDGVIGPQTLTMLNLSPQDRLDRIDVNLERWRWMPEDLGKRHVLVNIAGFDVRLVDDGEVVWRSPVVVGRDYRRTPVFSDRIRYLVLNPDWVVPPRLASQDKLPEIRRNPDYLARQGYRVYDGWGQNRQVIDPTSVDWESVSSRAFPYRLVQQPGPLNALGQVKFMFPNQYNVYLHDTPSRELFNRPERAFSSGCVRVKDPLELATLLLGRQDWTKKQVDDVIASDQLRTVYLREPVPVHIQYWNAWVDGDGELQIRRDIYERDGAILSRLREEIGS